MVKPQVHAFMAMQIAHQTSLRGSKAVKAQRQCTVLYGAELTRVNVFQAPQHLVQEELMMLRCQVIICLDYLQHSSFSLLANPHRCV